MPVRGSNDRSEHLWFVSERVAELAPWTDPEVVVSDGCAALQVKASHLLRVIASNASGVWRLETRQAFGTETEAALGGARDLDVRWDGDVSAVADEVLAVCVREWTRTLNSSEFSDAMKAKAAEMLQALEQLRSSEAMVEAPSR
jgi:hypothetical protein